MSEYLHTSARPRGMAPVLRVLALLVALPVAASAAEKPVDVKAVVARVQKLYDGTRDFSAEFKQVYEMKALQRSQESTGRVAFIKPGRIRFDYLQPMQKTYAVDGSTLWVYQAEDGQALVDRCFKADGLTASLVFLGGQGKILDVFDVTLVDADDATHGLRLVPKVPQAAFQAITLWVDRKTGEVRRSIVEDQHGNPNAFIFSAVKRNGGIKPAVATFTPPAGVAVNPLPGSCVQP